MSRLETPEDARLRLEAEGLRDEERERLWQRIEQRDQADDRRRQRARGWLVAVPAAVLTASVSVWLVVDERAAAPGQEAPVATREQPPPCALDVAAPRLRLARGCQPQEVDVDGDAWQLVAGTEVARGPTGPRVVAGQVRFKVRPRTDGETFQVAVSHGRVRVIGTVFTIVQGADAGSVAVSEGVTEFVWQDGARERVPAGQTLSWPRSEPASEAAVEDEGTSADDDVEASPKSRDKQPRPPLDVEQVTARLLQLRSQRRHDEAVDLLAQTLRASDLSTVQRERISYELGLSLEAAQRPACPHWRRHATRFGAKLHQAELEERLARCPR